MIEHKPKPDTNNNYIYVCGISVFGSAVGGYLLYTKFKKPEQNLIDIPPPTHVRYENTKTKPHVDIFEMHLKILSHIYTWLLKITQKI